MHLCLAGTGWEDNSIKKDFNTFQSSLKIGDDYMKPS